MAKKQTPWNQFAVMWDCHGLEAVQAVPNPADATFALLQNKQPPSMPAINHWALRAQFNPQRNYEIYIVNATKGISVDDIKEMFEANPQNAADTIRRLGHCYYNGRSTQKQVIT